MISVSQAGMSREWLAKDEVSNIATQGFDPYKS